MTEAAANAIAAGVKVWVPDADEAWVSATVTSVDGDDAVVHVAGAKSAEAATRTIRVRECNLQEREDREDMVKLNYLHEPGVLHNLGNRYGLDEIYTYTGSILIAARPRAGRRRARPRRPRFSLQRQSFRLFCFLVSRSIEPPRRPTDD